MGNHARFAPDLRPLQAPRGRDPEPVPVHHRFRVSGLVFLGPRMILGGHVLAPVVRILSNAFLRLYEGRAGWLKFLNIMGHRSLFVRGRLPGAFTSCWTFALKVLFPPLPGPS